MNTQKLGQTDQTIELCWEYLSVRCIWLDVLVMSCTHFRVNLHSIFAWISRNFLLETGRISISLTKCLSLYLQTKWLWVPVPLQSLKLRYRYCFKGRVLDIQANIKCEFTLKCVRDVIRTYSQMHPTDKYSQHSSCIWSIWPNGWVFVYELSGCWFESRCSHLNFRSRAGFEQGVPWHSSK